MGNGGSQSMLEKQLTEKKTADELRKRVEQITGIDFEGAEPHNLRRKDWKNLVHFLETEGENTDSIQLKGGSD